MDYGARVDGRRRKKLNLGGVKVQKMGGTEATDNDGGNKKEEPDDDQQP